MSNSYVKSIELLEACSSDQGFVASANSISNYKRVWARDGIICGLAALASNDDQLIKIFKKTIETLAQYQHKLGTIPSNVGFENGDVNISYGGLAGRVDAVTWFIIGLCQYAYHTTDINFLKSYDNQIKKCLHLLDAWEFNNKHLLYVPLSGNWADEYITDGYVLYDQLLRLWALKSYNHFNNNDELSEKILNITSQIKLNFLPKTNGEKVHQKVYKAFQFKDYLPCSFSPSGYKTPYDCFANSLAILLNIPDDDTKENLLLYAYELASSTELGLCPAFWPPIKENSSYWGLLKDNCKYEFRNKPYEFHNGGSWPMVNGFFGIALHQEKELYKAKCILDNINKANAVEDFSFYENFNTKTTSPNGVSHCAWSAAGSILLHQSISNDFKFLI